MKGGERAVILRGGREFGRPHHLVPSNQKAPRIRVGLAGLEPHAESEPHDFLAGYSRSTKFNRGL